MRYGFAVKVLGNGGLPSHDTRRWQSGPHLRHSIACLSDIFSYLDSVDIRMYRISSDFVPYGTHPDLPQFHGQIAECDRALADLGRRAREMDLRLSLHPSQYVVLNAADPDVAGAAIRDLDQQSLLLDAMGMGEQCVVITHVGGLYGDREAALGRFVANWRRLSEAARRRLVLENDERCFSVRDISRVHQQIGIRLIFDFQHHMLNPSDVELPAALQTCLATWPAPQQPKIHYSSSRTELREVIRKNSKTGKRETVLLSPLPSQHGDFVNPLEFLLFMEQAGAAPNGAEAPFDIMLEAKAKDLAVLALRRFLKERGRMDLLDTHVL